MRIPFHQIDAFTSERFSGNPAAVCELPNWLPDETLQAIAQENNLSETAFFVRNGKRYDLRWFTPVHEVDLCGHATLAAGYVILNYLSLNDDVVNFDSHSGPLAVHQDGDIYTLDFPARPPKPLDPEPGLVEALGGEPRQFLAAEDMLVVYKREEDVRALNPDFIALGKLDTRGFIVTAPGTDCDFVSRFFAPRFGIDEDPVTGSAHCVLAPYWAERLGRNRLHARQVSKRGGELWCHLHGDRVEISGHAVKVIEGTLKV